MNTAPIIVFSYNRPDHFQKTIDALSKNDLASDSILYIYCDGLKQNASEEQAVLVEKCKSIAYSVVGFREVRIVERDKNLGLASNIVQAVSEIVNHYGRVIVLEDDLVTSPFFLRFMNEALDIYETEDRVMHISGYMWPHKGKLPDIFMSDIPNSWGWATWRRAWEYFIEDASFLYHIFEYRWTEFNKLGGDFLQRQLVDNYNGKLHTWYIKWYATILLRNGLTIYPGESLVDNIGMDGSGTNCSSSSAFTNTQLGNRLSIKKVPLSVNKKATREMYVFYQGRWYNKRRRKRLISKIIEFFKF